MAEEGGVRRGREGEREGGREGGRERGKEIRGQRSDFRGLAAMGILSR